MHVTNSSCYAVLKSATLCALCVSALTFGSLFIPVAANAQQPANLIAGDPFSCFSMSAPDPSYARLSTVTVDGPGFSRAWRIETLKTSANPWDIRPRCFNTLPAKQGDTGLVTFWIRTLSSTAGKGFTTFVVEKGASPWTKSAEWTLSTGAEWQKVEIPFTFAETYNGTGGGDSYNLSFWVTFDPQVIEVGGLSVLDYGPNYPYSQLGLTNWPYEGHALDATWRQAASERIEKYRKADIAVIVRDDNGNPVPGAAVRVKMKRHAFGFGSAVAGAGLMSTTAADAKYQEMIPKLFNKVVLENDLKWPFWETWSRQSAAYGLDWLPAHGITMVRGHNVIWPDKGNMPPDLTTLLASGNKDALRKRIYDHIAEVMAFTKGKVTEWDVLNEPYTSKDVQAVLGDEEMAVWFKKARAADPNVKLYINDFNILAAGGYDLRHQDAYFATIKLIRDLGGPLDGIGLQSHFSSNLTPPERVVEILDRFAQFGADLQVTEFDVNLDDEQTQADFTRDFLTACFSHPAIRGFLMWGFWEARHWLPRGAMYRRDWSIKPNGEVWNNLVFSKWWTDVQGTADAEGVFRTRGFLGDYDIEVTVNGQTKTMPLRVESGRTNFAPVGKQSKGTITSAGIGNAASYATGAVAPGEIVTIFGTGFGPKTLAVAAYGDGQLARITGDTRVLFDGVAAPMIYAVAGQVSAIVPFAVTGSTAVQVEYQGTATDLVSIPVVNALPGIFTADSSGKGPAIAFNIKDDGSATLNSAGNPAQKGKFITFFLTGEGQTTPPGVDGRLPLFPYPAPAQPVSVSFGGVESKAADNWMGLIYAGVLQLNIRVPLDAPSGAAIPLVVAVGGIPSQAGVTIAIL